MQSESARVGASASDASDDAGATETSERGQSSSNVVKSRSVARPMPMTPFTAASIW
jgi:hypothetical protein